MQQQQQTFQGFQQGAMFQPFGAGNPMNMQGVQGYQAAPQMAFQQQQQQQQLSKCKITPAPYSRYLEFDCQKNITIQVCINTIKYCTPGTFVGKLSPKVIYDRESVVIGKHGKRTTARFASGKCFDDKPELKPTMLKMKEKDKFFYTALVSITEKPFKEDEYKKLLEASNLTDAKENFGEIAVSCGVHFDGLFEAANEIRASQLFYLYFIEGTKRRPDCIGVLYHVLTDYKDGDFEVGKELITKHFISCTNDSQIIAAEAKKNNTPYILKFMNVPAKVIASTEKDFFNEAVVLVGLKVKVSKNSEDQGFTFIELVPVEPTTWDYNHILTKKKQQRG